MIFLDTHVVVWLYAGETARLSPRATESIESEDVAVSPIVLLELQYLRETDRFDADPCLVLEKLRSAIGLACSQTPFEAVILEALTQTWTRDPFDRLISAQAILARAPLLTKDKTILENCPMALW